MNLARETRAGAVVHLMLIAAVLGVVAALAPVPPFTDRLVFESVGRHPFARGCADLNCFRVVVPWITAHIPFGSMTRMKLFAVVCQAAGAVAVGRLSLLLGLAPSSARLAMWLSALGAGSFASIANPYSADPLIFLLSPIVLALLLRERIALAAAVSAFGIFAKEFAAVPLWLFAGYAWMAPRRDVRARSLAAAIAVTAAWLALQIVLIVWLQFSYGGNPSSQLFAGGYARVWLRELGPARALVALFTTFGPLYLLMPAGLRTCGRPLRLLMIAAVPAALAFAYVETPERALWNFFFLAVPLAAIPLGRLPAAARWAFVACYGLANLRIGAQIMIVPASRYALLASGALAVTAIAMRRRSLGQEPLRILLVTGAYFPELSSGGLQCQAVARQLRGRVECRVLATAIDPTLPRHDVVEGVPVSRIAIDVNSRASKVRAAFALLAELMRLMPRVDVVHLHGVSRKNIAVTAVARLFRRPIVLSLHTAKHDEPETVAVQGRLPWWAYRAADAYLAVSPGLKERYLAAALPPDKLREAPNGVDLERFSPATTDERAALRRRLGVPADRPIVLFVGLIAPDKQPRVLFDAWLTLQEDASFASTLWFVGATSSKYFEVDGRLAADLRAEADRSGFGERVLFVEPTHQVEDYFRAADLFVLPSAREGLPVALLEAMAAGLPVIASRLPGSTDVIIEDDVNGILVPPGDVAALTAALRRVLADSSAAAALGAAARSRAVRDYGSPRTAERWLEAYQQVALARAAGRANSVRAYR